MPHAPEHHSSTVVSGDKFSFFNSGSEKFHCPLYASAIVLGTIKQVCFIALNSLPMNYVLRDIHEWRFNVKLFSLLLTLLFFCIIHDDMHGQRDSVSNKEYCISEKKLCTSSSANYGSGEFTQVSFLPICYSDRTDNLCVGSTAYNCLNQQRSNYNGVQLEDEIIVVLHDYFQWTTAIIVVTSLSALGTLLFQSSTKCLGISFVQGDSAFLSKSAADFFVDKIISAFSMVSFSLIVVSSEHYKEMMQEQCDQTSNQELCFDLELCSLDIRSIVFPSGWFAREYSGITIFLALFLLVFEMYAFIFPPLREDDADFPTENGYHIRQITIRRPSSYELDASSIASSAENVFTNTFVYVVQTPRGTRVSRRYTHTAPSTFPRSPRSQAQSFSPTRYTSQHQTFKAANKSDIKNWTFGVPVNSFGEEAECSICLELFHKKPTFPQDTGAVDKKRCSAVVRPSVEEDSGDEDSGFRTSLQLVVRLPCGHHFHEMCMFEWLRENPTCPICRASATRTGEVSQWRTV